VLLRHLLVEAGQLGLMLCGFRIPGTQYMPKPEKSAALA
jgi:hypothetical protein